MKRFSNYFDLSGGQQNRTTKYFKQNNECELVFNGVFTKIGGVEKRNGYTQLGAALGTGDPVRLLKGFNYGGSNERLIAVSDTDAYVWNGSAWSYHGLTLTDEVMDGATFLNQFFLVGLENTTRSYNGSAWSTTTNVTDAPQGKYVVPFQGRLYIAHCKVGSDYFRSSVYFSSVHSDAYAISWDESTDVASRAGHININTDNGEYINGIVEYGNRLLILKLSTVHRFYGDANGNTSLVTIPGAVGTSSHRSVVVHNQSGLAYWYHPKHGVQEYNGEGTRPVSIGIQEYVDGVSDPTAVVGWQEGYNIVWYVGTVTHPTDPDLSLTNGIFIYDTLTKRFSVGEVADTVHAACVWYNSSEIETFFGVSDGEVFEWDPSARSDDGTAITFNVRFTTWDDSPHMVKLYERQYIYADPQGSLAMRYRVIGKDGDGRWQPLIGLDKNITEVQVKPGEGEGRGIEFEFMEAEDDTRPLVEGITSFYDLVGAYEEE